MSDIHAHRNSLEARAQENLQDQITLFQRKLRGLTKAGPGAGMAAAATSVRLRSLEDEARSRGIEL